MTLKIENTKITKHLKFNDLPLMTVFIINNGGNTPWMKIPRDKNTNCINLVNGMLGVSGDCTEVIAYDATLVLK